jgi:hypothetical protein
MESPMKHPHPYYPIEGLHGELHEQQNQSHHVLAGLTFIFQDSQPSSSERHLNTVAADEEKPPEFPSSFLATDPEIGVCIRQFRNLSTENTS